MQRSKGEGHGERAPQEDLDLSMAKHNKRLLEVVANALPLRGGTRLPVDATLVLPISKKKVNHREMRYSQDGAGIAAAKAREEGAHLELLQSRRFRLVRGFQF